MSKCKKVTFYKKMSEIATDIDPILTEGTFKWNYPDVTKIPKVCDLSESISVRENHM